MIKIINKFLLILLVLYISNNSLKAEEITYKLKRYDTNYYDNSYKNDVKQKVEKLNRFQNTIKVIKAKAPIKNGKYEGVYKIGKPYTIMGKTYYPHIDEDYVEVGMASWYGKDFHNKKTSNGETYNMNDFTAAHRTLPMPSIVRVTNLENGRSIKVRINDRGPFVKNRIIDVSKRVAQELNFHNQGTTKVKVEYLKEETDKMLKEYGLK